MKGKQKQGSVGLPYGLEMIKVDSEGYLYLSGRKKELINRVGEKFSPREIDEVLYSIPGVELAAAVGVPDEIYGEVVVAFIKKKLDADFNEQFVFNLNERILETNEEN